MTTTRRRGHEVNRRSRRRTATLVLALLLLGACSDSKPRSESSPTPSASRTAAIDVRRVDELVLRAAGAFRLVFGLSKAKDRAEYLATLDLANADLAAVVRELSVGPPAGVPEDDARTVAARLEALLASQKALRTCFGTSRDSECTTLKKAANDRFEPAAEAVASTLGAYGSRTRSAIIALWRPSA